MERLRAVSISQYLLLMEPPLYSSSYKPSVEPQSHAAETGMSAERYSNNFLISPGEHRRRAAHTDCETPEPPSVITVSQTISAAEVDFRTRDVQVMGVKDRGILNMISLAVALGLSYMRARHVRKLTSTQSGEEFYLKRCADLPRSWGDNAVHWNILDVYSQELLLDRHPEKRKNLA
ncbi:hypothetical protein RRG08_014812 [Elysia crispata]|uniref:Uncharacterized protein n=1 Tax=Elysia crispata TaxID=231223 RepID=A0AAE0Z8M3_9GAST|nr:hypothetical protein RRG08_014812 [Elysia crispata]